MFKRFDPSTDIASIAPIRTSKTRTLRKVVDAQFPQVGGNLIPKNTELLEAKCSGNVSIIVWGKRVLGFKIKDGAFLPSMKLLHMYPTTLKQVQVDKGAIPFLMAGANCMCPGLTSPEGKLPDGIEENTPVAIMCEGKEHAIGIGIMKMSSEQVKKVNKGIAIELLHYIGDGLFNHTDNFSK